MDSHNPYPLIISMPEPLSDELAAAMADLLFELAHNFDNAFYAQIQRHYAQRQTHPSGQLSPAPKDSKDLLEEQEDDSGK